MLPGLSRLRWISYAVVLIASLPLWRSLQAQPKPPAQPVLVVEIEGVVEVSRAGSQTWDLASAQPPYNVLKAGDQLRTRARSRAAVRLADQTVVRLGPSTVLRVLPQQERRTALSLVRGLLYLFHRDKPGEFFIQTPTATPVIRGTEFNLEVADDGTTILHMFEGTVDMANAFGTASLTSGQAAIVRPNAAPVRMAALPAANVIQWCLYYPAIVDPDELQLEAGEAGALEQSLAAFRRGDLLKALDEYPAERQPLSVGEKLYFATLMLAIGQVSDAEKALDSLPVDAAMASPAIASALRKLIAAVKFQEDDATLSPDFATAFMAESYYQQSRGNLEAALQAARAAVAKSPTLGSAWARVSELEFAFGRTRQALKSLTRSLELSPRNAEAVALKGFILMAQSRFAGAELQFEEALGIDPALGNAWLGRGLVRIHRGQIKAGLEDLQMAVTLEPQRALLRDYLGKGYIEAHQDSRAETELRLGKTLDPGDPTSWFYSALFNQQRNRINDAIDDLQRSQQLNDNRRVYRSRLLLDQDQAVRGANLANLYRDAGMAEVGQREAARAADTDYANYAAHLYLAQSYNNLRQRDFINLRYETVAFSELLLANLLAPAEAGAFSQYISLQEYTRLFERPTFGLSSATEYLSRGDWQQLGSQYGTFGRFSYALDADYRSQNGFRPNNDLSLLNFAGTVKYQLTPQDMLFVQSLYSDFESGDVRQYFDQSAASPTLRIRERQQPNVFFGYHREWTPGMHTLLLAGRLHDDFRLRESSNAIPIVLALSGIPLEVVMGDFSRFNSKQQSELVAYTAEVEQIWQSTMQTAIVGARYQNGSTDAESLLHKVGPSLLTTNYPSGVQENTTDFQRFSVYAYEHWKARDWLWLLAGVSYDRLSYPENIDLPPISARELDKDQISPKAGLILTPTERTTIRAAYTRSLGGLYYDNSVRLEPTHIAGFNQAYRSLIPESVGGLAAGTEFETWSVGLDHRFKTGTYAGAEAQWLRSWADRSVGVFTIDPTNSQPPAIRSQTPQHLEFDEKSLVLNLNQLVGRDFALGGRYRLSAAELNARLTALDQDPVLGTFSSADINNEAVLQQLTLFALWNHPSGFFAQFQALWTSQANNGYQFGKPGQPAYMPELPPEDFWQFNTFGGYRFPRRRAEVLIGVLNLSGQDYRLNPLSLYAELPRERTLLVSFKFNF